jgi:hypothetical protein
MVFSFSCLSLAQAHLPTLNSKNSPPETIEVLKKAINKLKQEDSKRSYYADALAGPQSLLPYDCQPPTVSCVKNCNSRFSDGSCANYGPDYCGPRANCSARCTSRYSDGSCAHYVADFCGPEAQCTPNCRSRYSDGTCASYGEDACY